MALYQLTYQRLAERPRRLESPALAIAASDLRMLRKRRALRVAFNVLAGFTLLAVGYVIIRYGLIDRLLPEAWRGFADKLPAVDVKFFAWLLRSDLYAWVLFLLALFAGASRIAADLGSNALAIYLSKPVTRTDYLLGKIAATASVIALGALGTPLLIFIAAALSAPGFLAQNLRTGAALVGFGVLAAAYLTAAVLLCSSLARSGRIAGLLFAALFFMSGNVESLLRLIFGTNHAAFLGLHRNLETVAAHLLGSARGADPPLLPALLMMALVIGGGFAYTRRRVQAVEVVK